MSGTGFPAGEPSADLRVQGTAARGVCCHLHEVVVTANWNIFVSPLLSFEVPSLSPVLELVACLWLHLCST